MKSLFQSIILIILTFSLSACGFHLRGEGTLPPQLKTIYIDAAPYAPLTLQLQQAFKSAGVAIANSRTASPLTLQILNENFSQNVANISANTLVRTYNLVYQVQFQLLNKAHKVIYGPKVVAVNGTYAVNENQILGDSTQLDSEQAAMRREIIGLLFNLLGSNNVKEALAHG